MADPDTATAAVLFIMQDVCFCEECRAMNAKLLKTNAVTALARLVQLAPQVFPAVAVAKDWNTALQQARDVVTDRKGSDR